MKTESIISKQILSFSVRLPFFSHVSRNSLYKCCSFISLSWEDSLAFFSLEKSNLSSFIIALLSMFLFSGERELDFLKKMLFATLNFGKKSFGELSLLLFCVLISPICMRGFERRGVKNESCFLGEKREFFAWGRFLRVLYLKIWGIGKRSIKKIFGNTNIREKRWDYYNYYWFNIKEKIKDESNFSKNKIGNCDFHVIYDLDVVLGIMKFFIFIIIK